MKFYHNPRCRKSREALQLLHDKGQSPEVVEYLKTPLGQEELASILEKLGIRAEELLRKGEAIYKEEYKGQALTEVEWIKAMITHPKLMERPILVKGDQAVIGRPPERVLELI